MPGHAGEPQNTFVVRFWWEWQGEGSEPGKGWRGRVEHVQSGEGVSFCDADDLIAFIARFIPLRKESAASLQDSTSEEKVG